MTDLPAAAAHPPPMPDAETAILRLAREAPELGQVAVAERLRQSGLKISPSGVRYLWQKHGLETAVKRLQALAEQEQDGIEVLSAAQRRLLARGMLTERLVRGEGAEARALGEQEPTERRRLILDAAARLFAAEGYDRTSIRDIARNVGLLPGSVYHYFASKRELFLAVHREGFEHTLEQVKAAARSSADPWECLRRACEAHVVGIVGGTSVDRLAGSNLAQAQNDELLHEIRPHRAAYEAVFKTLIDALPLREGTDRSLLRLFLLGGMNWTYLWYREGKRTPGEIATAMVEMVRTGVQR
ncbi:TetR/AcrR family transcriptional regulator [Thauera sp.]|uniref:TetR/AcrR family transcriptional regulator n=1 Tax=Thauera sp. TaxID=1905334 RepID=UPI00260726D3|nr:TetR/AcrR family transcriptional regulator [Thauera sp.]